MSNMNTISLGEFAENLSQTLAGSDTQFLLAAAVLGVTIVLRILHGQYRARIARRLQAAAAAYAARELARVGEPFQGDRSRG